MAQAHPTELMTARLRLACASRIDPVDLAAVLNDFEILRWLTRAPFPYTAADAEAFVERRANEPALVWGIHDADGLAGIIGIDNDFGYWLARRAWGHGYATEAGRGALAVLFADATVNAVQSSYFEGNAASARVLQKLGFRDLGPCMLPSLSNGRDMDGRKMRLTRADWLAVQA